MAKFVLLEFSEEEPMIEWVFSEDGTRLSLGFDVALGEALQHTPCIVRVGNISGS